MASDNLIYFLKNGASSMTSLRSLVIRLASVHLTENFGQLVSDGALRTLGIITFGLLSDLDLAGDFYHVKYMLNILLVPKLVTLRLEVLARLGDTITDINPLVQGFLTSNGRYLDRLRSLSLRARYAQLSIEGYLSSFKVFTNLDKLEIHTASNARFHILTLGLADFLCGDRIWSNLTSLSLGNDNDTDRSDDVLSIAALPLLADTFPRLQYLEISIYNPDQATMKAIAANAVRRSHSLKALWLFKLPQKWIYDTSSAVAFASFLYQVFPKLKVLYSSEHYEWMNNVQEMLKKEQSAPEK